RERRNAQIRIAAFEHAAAYGAHLDLGPLECELQWRGDALSHYAQAHGRSGPAAHAIHGLVDLLAAHFDVVDRDEHVAGQVAGRRSRRAVERRDDLDLAVLDRDVET